MVRPSISTCGRAYVRTNVFLEVKVLDSPLAHQTASLTHFTDGKGYAVGSIAGRVSIQYFDSSMR
jgi:hypothetical protein